MAQILVFGDSITDGSTDSQGGWADRLKRFLWSKNIKGDVTNGEYYWFYNLGISGNMTADVLRRIEVESIARKVERKHRGVVFVFAIGINDAVWLDNANKQPRVSDEEFSNNYRSLVSFAQKYTDNILCIGITPVDEARTTPIYGEYWYKNERIISFNKIIETIAAENNTEFLEVYEPLIKEPNFAGLMDDGLHPNDDGHKMMYELIEPRLTKILESLK